LKVEIRDSKSKELLETITPDTKLADSETASTLRIKTSNGWIAFENDPEGWIRGLPGQLSLCSFVYAEVTE